MWAKCVKILKPKKIKYKKNIEKSKLIINWENVDIIRIRQTKHEIYFLNVMVTEW